MKYNCPRPAPRQTDATATVLRNHSFIELTESMVPEAAASIVAHELTHSLYDSASQADHLKLISQFTATKHPSASALYGVLNEALATGIQLLLDERYDVEDEDVYRHPYIPRAGRATMPLLKQAIAQRTTILSGFVSRYVAAVEREVENEITAPRFQLLAACVLASEKNRLAREAFLQTFRMVSSCRTEKELQQYASVPAVRLITYDEQDELTKVPEYTKLSTHRAFAYRIADKRLTYVIAGRDNKALIETAEELVKKSSEVPAQGLLLALD